MKIKIAIFFSFFYANAYSQIKMLSISTDPISPMLGLWNLHLETGFTKHLSLGLSYGFENNKAKILNEFTNYHANKFTVFTKYYIQENYGFNNEKSVLSNTYLITGAIYINQTYSSLYLDRNPNNGLIAEEYLYSRKNQGPFFFCGAGKKIHYKRIFFETWCGVGIGKKRQERQYTGVLEPYFDNEDPMDFTGFAMFEPNKTGLGVCMQTHIGYKIF